MELPAVEDRLELLGTVLGVFVVLTSLGALVGMPWATNPDTLAVLVQLVGILLSVTVGVALVWLVRTD